MPNFAENYYCIKTVHVCDIKMKKRREVSDGKERDAQRTRVGKVSGIEVSGRVSGMPEMPGTKPGFGRPKLPKTINLEI